MNSGDFLGTRVTGRDSNKCPRTSQTVSAGAKWGLYLVAGLREDGALRTRSPRYAEETPMTPRAWRQAGYRTIIRHGTAYLYRPATEEVIAAPLQQGDWPATDNLGAAPWVRWSRQDEGRHPELLKDFRATAATCYCDQGPATMCDYCAGTRRSPWLPAE